MAKLAECARFAAEQSGEKNPHDATVVATTRQAVNELIGDRVNTNPDVFVVTLQGDFTAYAASIPQGATLPSGHVITLVLRGGDLEGLDAVLGNRPLDLGRLGQVEPLSLNYS
jgi:hypothetical protein